MIGKIQRVPLREVWKHEALDFTKWLQDNGDVLNEVLDISLTNAEREQSAGDFQVDLVAEDEAGNPVVIENQLEKSNHDHLGKLVTYLSMVGAKTAIWIVADPRPEHIRAVGWLNESSAAAFYLLKVEGIRIGDSPPRAAPHPDRRPERGDAGGRRSKEGDGRAVRRAGAVLGGPPRRRQEEDPATRQHLTEPVQLGRHWSGQARSVLSTTLSGSTTPVPNSTSTGARASCMI